MIPHLERFVAPLAIILTLLAAIPFGSNRPWAWIIFGVLATALLLLQILIDLSHSTDAATARRQLGLMPWAMIVLIVWILYQSSGLPPVAWHHPIYTELSDFGAVKSAISITPAKGFQFALRFATYLALFWIVYRYTLRNKNADKILIGICAGYAILALYTFGTIGTGLYKTHVLWFEHPWSGVAPSGTFVNQNHFAAHMAIGAICAAGLVIGRYKNFAHHAIKEKRAARQAMLRELAAPGFIFTCIMFLMIGLCVLLSGSQAAIMSFTVALVALAAFATLPKGIRAALSVAERIPVQVRTVVVLLTGAAGLALTSWVIAPLISEADPFRANIYLNIRTAIWDNVWLGSGAGTFLEAFASYKGIISPNHQIAHAHNTFFQNILELGVPAAILLYLVLSKLFVMYTQGILKRRRQRWIPATGLAIMIYAGFHSILDFSFELPANAAIFAVVLAVTLAQANPKARSS